MIVTRYQGGKYSAVPNTNERNRARNRRNTVRLTKDPALMPDVAAGHAQLAEMSEQSAGSDPGVGDGGPQLVGLGQETKPESVSGDLTTSMPVGRLRGLPLAPSF